jgi:hypothetical protein
MGVPLVSIQVGNLIFGALGLVRPMLVGVRLVGVGEVAQQMRVTGLMPRQVLPAAMEVVAVAVVYRHPSSG